MNPLFWHRDWLRFWLGAGQGTMEEGSYFVVCIFISAPYLSEGIVFFFFIDSMDSMSEAV